MRRKGGSGRRSKALAGYIIKTSLGYVIHKERNSMMEWKRLMSRTRLCGGLDDPDDARTADLRDMDRLVFSSAFRRLQDKTQVFPLPFSDYVRTRLTHSIETSSVGRSIGAIVGKEVVKRYELQAQLAPINFGVTVGVACLAHDIGNPPFGHSGEAAIQHWFRTSDVARDLLKQLEERQKNDLLNFEGNAQGFRVLTRLQNADRKGGLQLTCSTLAAFTKYPRESPAAADSVLPEGASTKKYGFFQREVEHFEEVAETVGLMKRSTNTRAWVRHPLAFLVEAADDICYRIIDFEDGFRLGRVQYEEIRERLLKIINSENTAKRLDSICEEHDKVGYLRSKAIDILTRQAAQIFIENEEAIRKGAYDKPLISHIEASAALEEVKKRSVVKVYSAQEVIEIEAAGYEVIGGLLETFVGAANDCATNDKTASARSKKYLQLLPQRYSQAEEDPYKRILRITDYVAGMTDSFAVAMYKKIKGISLPNG